MSFLREFFLAIQYYREALIFISDKKLWRYMVLPAFFNVAAFTGVGILGWIYSGSLVDYLIQLAGFTEDAGFWKTLTQFLLSVVIRGLVVLIYLKLYRYIVLIFFAPILAFISELIQERANQVKRPFSMTQFVHDVLRGVGIALKNLLIEFSLYLLILLLTFLIPIISPISPILIFMVGSYFYGFSMIDYRNEFYFLSAKESRRLIWEHRGLALGNGLIFYMLILIPFLGVLIAPGISVVAAGLAMNEVAPAPVDQEL
jgi:CysZ protein